MKIEQELLSLIWEAVDYLREAGREDEAKWITEQTIKAIKEETKKSTIN